MHFAPRWRIALFLFAISGLNYLDRAAISIASPAIRKDLGLTAEQMGLVFSAFFVGYASMNFLGGWAADRYGPKRVLAASLALWSALCAITAAARGFTSLMALRVCFGAAEGPMGATEAKVISRWFPKHEISTAIAAAASGTPVGAMLAGPLMGLLLVAFDWRGALIVVGSIGVVFTLAWIRYAPEGPSSSPRADVAHSTRDAARPDETPERRTPRRLPERAVRSPTAKRRYFVEPAILANAAAYFAYTYLLSVYLSWLPLYFTSERHLDLVAAALGSSAPWVMGCVGIWVGGLTADLLYRKTGRLLFSRRCTQVGGLLVAALGTASLGRASSVEAAIVLVAVSLFALYLAGTSFWVIVQDLVPSEVVGKVSGFTHLIANIGGIAGPAITGAIVQRTASFELAWLTAGLVAVAAVAGVTVVSRFKAPPREEVTP